MDSLLSTHLQKNLSTGLNDSKFETLKQSASTEEPKSYRQLRKISKDFESILVFQMLKSMRATVPKSKLLGGYRSEMFESMFDQELANEISKGRGIGLSDTLYKQLVTLEESRIPAASKNPSPESPKDLTFPSVRNTP
ncbi:MAG: rod-binding protein [Nitrospinales bacterium]